MRNTEKWRLLAEARVSKEYIAASLLQAFDYIDTLKVEIAMQASQLEIAEERIREWEMREAGV